ncbi:MAG: AzlC family ABC transporter permease [Clostridia bacterium]|nr:AzlC family ABC transporter permease [Clostridia bacterium]
MKRKDFLRGFVHGIPIMLGYLAVSFSFGIFTVGSGLSVAEATLISLTNLTSAGQLAGVPIIAAGGSLIELALTQLVINMRYALMSVSLSQKLDRGVTRAERFLIAFGNTDEIFAVSTAQPHTLTSAYMYGLITSPVIGWTSGTLIGAIAGNILPPAVISALGVAIYGMLIAVVVPAMRERKATALCVALSVTLSCLFYYLPPLQIVPDGFVIIICAVVASALFAWLAPLPPAQEETEGGDAP